MNLLGGGVAGLFGELLDSVYLEGRVVTASLAYADDGTLTRAHVEAPCRVQVDAATERMVATEGYSVNDRALYVLRNSFAGSIDSDCEIHVDSGPYGGTRWRVSAPIDSDPGAAYWLCRGVPA